MREGTTAIVHRFYDAWNRHDAAAIGASFAPGGVYADPLTRIDLSGARLSNPVQTVLIVIRSLRITASRTVEGADAAAALWTLEGTWDGTLGPLTASDAPVRFEGTDVFDLDGDRVLSVRRSFDELAVADALKLQTIVEPYGDGDLTFGHS